MQSTPIFSPTVIAAAALAANRFVTFAGAVCGAGAKALGVAQYAAASGDAVAVNVLGTTKVEAGGAIAVGGPIKSDASGKAIPTVVVGDAIYDTDDTTTVDVWGTDAILAWVPPEGMRAMPLPSYGYTYQLANHPLVEAVEWDGDIRSWKNAVLDEFSAELVGADAGFLFQAAF